MTGKPVRLRVYIDRRVRLERIITSRLYGGYLDIICHHLGVLALETNQGIVVVADQDNISTIVWRT